MKKNAYRVFLTLFLFFFFGFQSEAQRLLKGSMSIAGAGGVNIYSRDVVKSNFYSEVDYGYFLGNGHYVDVGARFTQTSLKMKSDFDVPVHQYGLNGNFNLLLLNDLSATYNWYVSAGIVLGYDRMNYDGEVLQDGTIPQKKESFAYGGNLSTHLDVYLTNHWVLYGKVGTFLLGGSLLSTKLQPYAGVGIKIIL